MRNSIGLGLALLVTYYLLFTSPNTIASRMPGNGDSASWPPSPDKKPGPHPPELLNNLSLTTGECEAYFPGLTWAIEDVVSQGPFALRLKNTPLLGRISITPSTSTSFSSAPKYELSILQAQRRKDLSQEMLDSRSASLHQIHRALLTAPASDPILPPAKNKHNDDDDAAAAANAIFFSLNFQDQPFGTSWAYSRQADPHARPGHGDGDGDARTFLMPHFSFWAWKLPFVGSMWRAAAAVTSIEKGMSTTFSSSSSTTSGPGDGNPVASGFAAKIPKAVWRGTTWFNSVHNPRLRANLLAATKDQPWADVEALQWGGTAKSPTSSSIGGKNKKKGGNGDGGGEEGGGGGRTASNALPIEDFCRYKYVLHTEGVTYSGRFQFLQMCESVVLTPPIGWMQHTTHLVKPLFSHTLSSFSSSSSGNDDDNKKGKSSKSWTPSEATKRAWPTNYGPESGEANIVFVAPDWGDLEETIAWLEAHPDVAAGIARRQRETFVDGGYFSPAAETCYWRALIQGWSKVVRVDREELAEIGEGQAFEAFVLNSGD